MGQEPEVTDFHKARRENMQKEASDKLLGSKGHYSGFIILIPRSGSVPNETYSKCLAEDYLR